jgi:hypothetical protein
MTAGVEAVPAWSRRRWAAAILFVATIHLLLVLAFSHPPLRQQRVAEATRVILPEGMPPVLQTLTDPTLLALGGQKSFSAIWLEVPELEPVQTRWEKPPQWLGLASEDLGGQFLAFAQSNAVALYGSAFKTRPETVPESPRAVPEPLRTSSRLQTVGDLAHREVLSAPALPTWPAKNLLVPSRVRVVVNHRGFVTTAILQSGSGSKEADGFAVQQARQVRFAPVRDNANGRQLTLGELVFDWHTEPESNSGTPASSP